jgi:hypothetical protein
MKYKLSFDNLIQMEVALFLKRNFLKFIYFTKVLTGQSYQEYKEKKIKENKKFCYFF